MRLWDVGARVALRTVGSHGKEVSALKWGGDGLLYSAARDGLVHVWAPEAGTLVRTLKARGNGNEREVGRG